MEAIHYSECDDSHAGHFQTEAAFSQRGFDIRLELATWPSSGSALVETHNSCLIRLLLPSDDTRRTGPTNNLGSFSGDSRAQLKPLGSLLFIPHDTAFHLRHDVCQQKALICLFNPANLGPLAAYSWDWERCVHDSMLNLENHYLHASLQRLADEVESPGFASQLHTESLLTSIALELRGKYLGRQTTPAVEGKLSPGQLRQLNELLNVSPEHELSLHQLARLCDMPVRKLSIYFKNTTGVTLRRYAAQARINKAMALLSDPCLLIKQVAYQTGFLNPAAFTAAFRKEVGVTPEQFRSRQ